MRVTAEVGTRLRQLGRMGLLAGLMLGVVIPGASAASEPLPEARKADLARQMEEYQADRTKTVLELQPFRKETRATAADGTALRLVSINPVAHAWYLLEVTPPGGGRAQTYHIETAEPDKWRIRLEPGETPSLAFESATARQDCQPWSGAAPELAQARDTRLPYAPICGDLAYLRNPATGARSNREAVADFLRDHVIFGDSIVTMIKGTLYKDAFMQSSETTEGGAVGDVTDALGVARLDRHPMMQTYFGWDLTGASGGRVEAGAWYAVKDAKGIYASAMQPGMIARDILTRKGEAAWLDGVESRADVYMVGFDLDQFGIGYEVGTEHPRLSWSSRPRGAGRNWKTPGPDGIGSARPLVRTGMLTPSFANRVAATFTGGFKRDHGAFKYSDYATYNHGHHYGFITKGAILSKLQPDLSTLFVLDDGSIHMRTWTKDDAKTLLPHVIMARQNGVALIAPDPQTGEGVPGKFVRSWGGGNWSGSADADLRTLRAGACIKDVAGRKFLIYAYFSTATPSAMARTFQAYGCRYAMLLDMNAQEHTYMALYTKGPNGPEPRHLVKRMSAIDARRRDGSRIPRFVGYPDNRDFFYLLRKE